MSVQELELRLRRLEDREAIRELVGSYALAMDNRDSGLVARIFAEDACFRWKDDKVRADGRDAIVAMFETRFARAGFHFSHDSFVEWNDSDPDAALGLVFAHAEALREDAQYVAAIRYNDAYVRCGGRWMFSERVLNHLYFAPVREYDGILARRDRIKTTGGYLPGHWPEE